MNSQLETQCWPCPWQHPADHETVMPALAGHDPRWIESIRSGLNQRVYLLRTRTDDSVTGVLPLHLVSGPIFGKFLVSLPYINTGGVWATNEPDARRLVDAACDLADELNVRHLELRHETPIADVSRINLERTDKVHMRLALPNSSDELMKSFKSKLRSQVKKAGQYDLEVEFGRRELLADFYAVFAHNMRDLGTPVFARNLFEQILANFESNAELCIVRKQGQAISGGLLVHNRGVTEVPSASTLRAFNRTNANMWMYWHLLARAIERGSKTFDFGRSSEDSGTYKFKAQWGAKPYPAVWQYYVRKGSPESMRPDDEGKQRLVKLWQKLPVPLTKVIGPSIVRGIP